MLIQFTDSDFIMTKYRDLMNRVFYNQSNPSDIPFKISLAQCCLSRGERSPGIAGEATDHGPRKVSLPESCLYIV